uniref:Uncharacterized protein n=1 Tax=Arundo donax TaxID=35708 RepID=A0A0A9EX34_ARUDO
MSPLICTSNYQSHKPRIQSMNLPTSVNDNCPASYWKL